jgi:hypothetical protein
VDFARRREFIKADCDRQIARDQRENDRKNDGSDGTVRWQTADGGARNDVDDVLRGCQNHPDEHLFDARMGTARNIGIKVDIEEGEVWRLIGRTRA